MAKNVWWCPITTKYSSYDEFKRRKVFAQGWPELGDLSDLAGLGNKDLNPRLKLKLSEIDEESDGVLLNFSYILSDIKTHDLIVAIEGRTVMGICEVCEFSRYFYDERNTLFNNSDEPSYCNAYGLVEWVNWNDIQQETEEKPPSPSGQSFLGIKSVIKEKQRTINIWERFKQKTGFNPCPEQLRIETIELFDEIRRKKMEKELNGKCDVLEIFHQIILHGPPGTGKTYTAKEIVKQILGVDNLEDAKFPDSKNDKGAYAIVQFHPSYSYEDLVQGIVAKTNSNNNISYEVKDKILLEMAKAAQKTENKDKKYILILDEINRANLPSVLGELIYALEYRDEKVDLLYGKYGDDANKFSKNISLPANLYIIGTMNTADRSIGHIDYAIRRRFVFLPVQPKKELVHKYAKEWFEKVSELFDKDKKYLSPDFDAEDVSLGHSYYMVNNEDEANGKDCEILASKFAYQVLPLLREYYKDGILMKEAKLEIEGIGPINIKERIDYGSIYKELVRTCNEQKVDDETRSIDETTQLEPTDEE